MYISDYAIEKIFYELTNYFSSSEGKRTLDRLKDYYKVLNEKGESTSVISERLIKVGNILETFPNPVIVILKNDKDLFDMFVFEDAVEFNAIDLVNSNNCIRRVLSSGICGSIINNLSITDAFTFLKTYYICRKKTRYDSTKNNEVLEYYNGCLNIVSYNDMFKSQSADFNRTKLKNIILYNDEIVSYPLNYLDNYKNSNRDYGFKYTYEKILKDEYFGSSLRKYNGI